MRSRFIRSVTMQRPVRCAVRAMGQHQERDVTTTDTTNTAEPAIKDPKSSNELAQVRTDLASDRNMMAADRSLMAWIRTGLSMISFGFTIYKLLEGFQATGSAAAQEHSPRAIGMFLTGLGTVSILLGTVEYWQRLQELRAYQHFKIWRPSFVIALIMSATGVFLFVGIIAKLL